MKSYEYNAQIIRNSQSFFDELDTKEQAARQTRDRSERNQIEDICKKLRSQLLKEADASTVYLYLNATQAASDVEFRSVWQTETLKEKNTPLKSLKDWGVEKLYEDYFAAPVFDLSILPPCSFFLSFTFILAKPYLSKDDNPFYIIDNPIARDKVFRMPMVRPTSWKGNLYSALWQQGHDKQQDEKMQRLFGDIRSEDKGKAGRLFFYPTFFTETSLEIINPHDRKRRVGTNPILFESVRIGAKGAFSLLYVPFDLIGQDEIETRRQAAEDLLLITEGLQAMFLTYGFSAKRSSGFGVAQETLINGAFQMRVEDIAPSAAEQPAPPVQALPGYLAAPGKLKDEYLTPDGAFRERSEAELKAMKKSDHQQYEKAQKWWGREGKAFAEQPPASAEPQPEAALQWLRREFDSFDQLCEKVKEVAQGLQMGGAP